jgi:small subunit ribosomal protein S6
LNTYEALIVVPVSLRDEELDKALEAIREELERAGGRVDRHEVIGKRSFARPMKKRDSGQYVRFAFAMAPDRLEPLHRRFNLNESILRVQITRRDRKDREPEAAGPQKETASDGES